MLGLRRRTVADANTNIRTHSPQRIDKLRPGRRLRQVPIRERIELLSLEQPLRVQTQFRQILLGRQRQPLEPAPEVCDRIRATQQQTTFRRRQVVSATREQQRPRKVSDVAWRTTIATLSTLFIGGSRACSGGAQPPHEYERKRLPHRVAAGHPNANHRRTPRRDDEPDGPIRQHAASDENRMFEPRAKHAFGLFVQTVVHEIRSARQLAEHARLGCPRITRCIPFRGWSIAKHVTVIGPALSQLRATNAIQSRA